MTELKPCEHLNVTVTTARGPYCVDCGALLVSVFSGVERAQPAQAVPASCAECGKKTSDGWALYCVACMEEAGLPGGTSSPPLTHSCTSSLVRTADSTAQAVLLTDEFFQDEACKLVVNEPHLVQLRNKIPVGEELNPFAVAFGRVIEQAVRAKCGIVGKEGA